MKKLKRSIIFPELETYSGTSSLAVSKASVRELCDLRPVTHLLESFENFAVERTRTKELGKQLAAKKAAVDAEYNEFERQAYIEFSERTKRLKEEFRAKSEMLELELQKAEAEAETSFLKHKTDFEEYFKISSVYHEIFEDLNSSAKEIEGLLKLAEDIKLKDNRYYAEIFEKHRRIIRGIENYAKFTA